MHFPEETRKQLLEFSTELRVVTSADGVGDSVTSRNKRACFERLKDAYLAMGRRLLKVDVHDGHIQWPACGHYLIFDESMEGFKSVK
eukprot:1283908-Amphidinium_carterae.1